jgi:hypothetical protein
MDKKQYVTPTIERIGLYVPNAGYLGFGKNPPIMTHDRKTTSRGIV